MPRSCPACTNTLGGLHFLQRSNWALTVWNLVSLLSVTLTSELHCHFLKFYRPFQLTAWLLWQVCIVLSRMFQEIQFGKLAENITSRERVCFVRSLLHKCMQKLGTGLHQILSLQQWSSTWCTRTPGRTRRHFRRYTKTSYSDQKEQEPLERWTGSDPRIQEDLSPNWGAGMPEASPIISLTDRNHISNW
jgi:hypothetical protein